jgi:CubicO group peptidase (beta-lactamase class C family)
MLLSGMVQSDLAHALWHRASIIVLALSTAQCTWGRVFFYNTPTLAAPSYFDARAIASSAHPLALPEQERRSVFDLKEARGKKYASFDALLEENETRAFIAIDNGTVVYERYFDGFTRETLLPSFSISKTYAALLVGCALTDGLFPSLDAHLTDYVPSLRPKRGYAAIELEHLLRMASGIDYEEESTETALLYYTGDLRDFIGLYEVKWPAGTHYEYGSINIQLLWEALRATIPQRTVSEYFQERVWEPIGANHAATYSLDSRDSGIEKFFTGFNATARDHALLGLVYLNSGTLNEHTIVPDSFVRESLTPDPLAGIVEIADGRVRRGKYQWFLTLDGRAFFTKGYRGQYIFVIPESRTVFVRFGEGYGDVGWPALFFELAFALRAEDSATGASFVPATTRAPG